MQSSETIWNLIRSFPCLSGKLAKGEWNTPFDPDRFFEAACNWSSGEHMCALFILNVWNPDDAKDKGWKFNLFEFIGNADLDNKDAMVAWINDPVWP